MPGTSDCQGVGVAENRLTINLDREQVDPRASSYPAYPGDFSSLFFPHPRRRQQEIYSLEKINQRDSALRNSDNQLRAGGRIVPQDGLSENLDYEHFDPPNSFPM